MGQGISQIIKSTTFEEFLGHMVFEPEDFWNFHFNGHLATDVAKKIVSGCIDLVSLLNGTVVQPKDDITIRVEVRTSDGNGLIRIATEEGQRTSSVEANAANSIWIDVMLADSALHTDTDTMPDIASRLFLLSSQRRSIGNSNNDNNNNKRKEKRKERKKAYIVTSLWLPKSNILRGQSNNVTFVINNTGPGTSSTYINADVVVQVRVDLLSWIHGSLSGWSTRRFAIGNGGRRHSERRDKYKRQEAGGGGSQL